MSEKLVFVTGAGGFIGRYILSHYLDEQDCDFVLLEQGRFRERLEQFLDEKVADPARRERLSIVSGDISLPGLGLERSVAERLETGMTHAIHLAALYNLSAPRDISMRVNVDGTRNVLDFLERAGKLERFGYASTIALVGKFEGTFYEDDLDVGQGFKNYYDETKFLAERLVRKRRERIPTVIFRPATVAGHSKTGAIEKVDGPYYALGMIARNRQHVIPNTGDNKFHFAPVDFIAEAFYRLFEDEASVGKVFHLIDRQPLTYIEFLERACEVIGRRKPTLVLPASLMRPFGKLPGFEAMTGVPAEAFEHSFYRVEYDMRDTAPALDKHGVSCPQVASYLEVMVRYFLEHAEDPRIRKGDWKQVTT